MCTSLIHLRKKVSWPTPCASRAKEKKVHYFLPWHKKAKPLLTWFVMTCDCAIFKFLCECQSSGPCTMAFRLPLNKSILKWNIVIDFFSATISFMIFRFSALCASRFRYVFVCCFEWFDLGLPFLFMFVAVIRQEGKKRSNVTVIIFETSPQFKCIALNLFSTSSFFFLAFLL